MSFTIVIDKDNKPTGMAGVTRIIDDRKRMEAHILKQHHELLEKENKFRYITKNMYDIIFSVDIKSQIYTYVSESCHKAIGFAPEELINKSIFDAFPPDTVVKCKMLLHDIKNEIQNGGTNFETSIEFQRYNKNRELI